jgi:asparagine synthase (glutamine-hydrolysing)
MCGIAGYHGLPADPALLERMNAHQQHRGPDGDGICVDGPCGLAHRRLSIIDIAHGQQPMDTADGRYAIAYNGEVYNYLDLRGELEALGRTFTTDSDTEVVLQAFAQWGADAFDRFNGMFGLAIWDRHEQRLTLARDHFGIKPLYVAMVPNPSGEGEALLFSSEIKPILASGLYEKRVNDRSVYRYLRFRAHEDGTETFFEGIERLAPGEMLEADANGIRRRMFTRLKEELLELASVQRPYDAAAAAEYKRRLVESVRLRLQSEVPVGTSLSGGLDSSAVAVIINQLLNEGDSLSLSAVGARQNTFSAIFPGSINDEEKYVDDVLDICTGHVEAHKILPTADEFKADLLDFIRTQEEPIISSGPYAQYQVMREATKHVTVLLDGQGADEMMAGYIPYYFVYLRQLRAQGATLAAAELAKSLDVLYRLGRFKLKAKVKLKKSIPTTHLLNRDFVAAHRGERYSSEGANLKKRLVEDLFHNSLPSLLRYEDKNTMRFSLEGRVPFLDKEVLKFIFSLSDEAIIKDGWNKRVLRDATRGLLPESINRRRNKIGFTTPQGEWFMRLKNHFYNIFLSESFANRPYVNQTEVIAAFEGWIKGANDVDTMTFWRLINLELWMREFIDEHEDAGDATAATGPGQDRLRGERGAEPRPRDLPRRGRAPLPGAHRAVQPRRRPRRTGARAHRRLLRRAARRRPRPRGRDARTVVVLPVREGRRDHAGPLLLRLGHQGRSTGARAVALRDPHPRRDRPRQPVHHAARDPGGRPAAGALRIGRWGDRQGDRAKGPVLRARRQPDQRHRRTDGVLRLPVERLGEAGPEGPGCRGGAPQCRDPRAGPRAVALDLRRHGDHGRQRHRPQRPRLGRAG